MVRSKPIQVVVTPTEKQRLHLLAAQQEKTISSYVRDILLEHTAINDDSFFVLPERNTVHSEQRIAK